MCRRWQGPATVIKVESPHSYLVDMGDGRVRHVHANKMRKFHIRVQRCNVISEADSDFGRVIVPVNVSENVLPSINVDCDKLCHLSHTQQQELLQLLDEFACCFSNKPGLCTRRRLMTDFQKNFTGRFLGKFAVKSHRTLDMLLHYSESAILIPFCYTTL